MLPLIARGDPGITYPILIDGQSLSFLPSSIEVSFAAIHSYQDMLDGGGREWQRRPHFDGVANNMDRYEITFPLGSIEGTDLQAMETIRATGGIHRLVLWRMVPFVFTCIAGLQRYYLPRLRKCAGWLYDGVQIGTSNVFISTELFPTDADMDGDALAVTYAEGPTLASPGAGGLVMARQPDTSGDAIDFTAFMLGDEPAGGEVVTIWTAPAFEMSMRAPSIRIDPGARNESHSYVFVEL